MIQKEQLSIGDWITARKWREKPFQLTRINDGNKFFYGKNGDIYFGPFLIEELEPIQITLEILKKNGFKNDFYEEESIADYHKIRLEGYSLRGKVDGWDNFLITSCNGNIDVVTDFHGEFRGELQFVHELQRALRCCKLNELANNFKI